MKLRNLAFAIPRLPLSIAWSLIEKVVLGPAAMVSRSGVPLSDLSEGDESASRLGKIDGALALIAEHDMRRITRIKRDVSRIVIADLPGLRGAHLSRGKACYISRSFVESRSAALIALTIVHEATHRRIERQGVWYWPDLQTRIEARCRGEQRRFAELLPRGVYADVDEWLTRFGATS